MHDPTRLELQRRQKEEGYMMQTTSKTTEVVSRVCASKQFPGKLHDLLSYAEYSGLEWIISWVHHGKAFMVHSQQHLLQILPIFFGQTKFRSFQRQLNMWHFERILVGPFKGAFIHPFFQRGNKALCAAMSRHHLPSAEIYQQALAAGSISGDSCNYQNNGRVSQYILNDNPNKLVEDRIAPHIDPKAVKLAEWNRHQDVIKAIGTSEGSDAKPSAQESPPKYLHQTIETRGIENDSTTTTEQPFESGKDVNAALWSMDQGEDWSLLSECLERALHKDMSPKLTGCSSEGQEIDLSSIPNRYLPIEALAPGMDTPADPETIERIFLEFESL